MSFYSKIQGIAQKLFDEGEVFCNAGNYINAINKYKSCLYILPDSQEVWNNQAYAYNHIGKYNDAIISSQRAIALDIKYANPWRHCGTAYFGLKNYNKALECFNTALRFKPNYPEAAADKANCQKIIDELKALQNIRQCITSKVRNYQNIATDNINAATIAGFTFFYNEELYNEKQKQADSLISEANHLPTSSDVYPLLQRYTQKDKLLAGRYEKEPAQFTELLSQLTQDVKRFVRK